MTIIEYINRELGEPQVRCKKAGVYKQYLVSVHVKLSLFKEREKTRARRLVYWQALELVDYLGDAICGTFLSDDDYNSFYFDLIKAKRDEVKELLSKRAINKRLYRLAKKKILVKIQTICASARLKKDKDYADFIEFVHGLAERFFFKIGEALDDDTPLAKS